jgi:hypothetical protein
MAGIPINKGDGSDYQGAQYTLPCVNCKIYSPQLLLPPKSGKISAVAAQSRQNLSSLPQQALEYATKPPIPT